MIGDNTPFALREGALQLLEEVLLAFGATERVDLFSDTPIRIAVWRAFAGNPSGRQVLLIEPNNRIRAEQALAALRRSLGAPGSREAPALLAIGNILRVSARMDAMIAAILPCTVWFAQSGRTALAEWRASLSELVQTADIPSMRRVLARSDPEQLWRIMAAWAVIWDADRVAREAVRAGEPEDEARWRTIAADCEGLLAVTRPELLHRSNADLASQVHSAVVRLFAAFAENAGAALDRLQATRDGGGEADRAPIWSIDLNRPADLAVETSRRTINVDAAENVFDISTQSITWAVIDSGIDAEHLAFSDRKAPADGAAIFASRIAATYDFNRLIRLFEDDYGHLLPAEQTAMGRRLIDTTDPERPQNDSEALLTFLYRMNASRAPAAISVADILESLKDDAFRQEVRSYVGDVKRRITRGEMLDWPLLEPILRVPHRPGLYIPPVNGHGTHVAGILGGRLETNALPDRRGPDRPLAGICPDIRLYDLRVCDESGQSDEFLVMAALQFVAYLNRTRDRLLIQGANLSLQIRHQVRNYGCGQTPVCREANKLVDSGVCVVAAAGNRGYSTMRSETSLFESYVWSSIQDPGNAEKAITVGSTHRGSPHTFGVSYFSSRGPTGDGRQKPDLIAPGEKIVAPAPGQSLRTDTGTSMAAPHVSGAAALLLARNPEFWGRPLEVKEILCRTATDLGRRKEFQGAGLVNALRALESV